MDWVRLGIKAAEWSESGQLSGSRRVVAVSAPTDELATAAAAFGFVRTVYLAERVG